MHTESDDLPNSTLYGSSGTNVCGWMGQSHLLDTTQTTHPGGEGEWSFEVLYSNRLCMHVLQLVFFTSTSNRCYNTRADWYTYVQERNKNLTTGLDRTRWYAYPIVTISITNKNTCINPRLNIYSCINHNFVTCTYSCNCIYFGGLTYTYIGGAQIIVYGNTHPVPL